jgi:predicted transcriptional regulator
MSGTVTVVLEDEALQALDRLARRTNRSPDDLVSGAVRDYLALQEWQLQKIEAGIAAADRFEFASDAELDRIVGKYSAAERGLWTVRPPAISTPSRTTSPAGIQEPRGGRLNESAEEPVLRRIRMIQCEAHLLVFPAKAWRRPGPSSAMGTGRSPSPVLARGRLSGRPTAGLVGRCDRIFDASIGPPSPSESRVCVRAPASAPQLPHGVDRFGSIPQELRFSA